MEVAIGRRLVSGECVHHIDGDKTNNEVSNLQLLTLSEHASLHRLEEISMGKHRERDKNGRFR